MKKILALIMAFGLMLCADCYGQDITITVDGNELVSDTPAQIVEGRTLVPVRPIFEALGAEVSWEETTKTVTATMADTTIVMQINAQHFIVNGNQWALDVPALIINGRTMVPARSIGEGFGCDVSWDSATKTVNVITAEQKQQIWTDFFVAEDINPAPVDYTLIKDESLQQLHKNARYDFEQRALPQAIFYNKDEIATYLENKDTQAVSDFITKVWDKNSANAIIKYCIDSDEAYVISGDEGIQKLISQFEGDAYLYESDNMGICCGMINDATYLTLLELADDEYITYCKYIAVVYNKEYGFRYFTLEKSINDAFVVCEVFENSRSNYVVLSASEATKLNFLEIMEKLL